MQCVASAESGDFHHNFGKVRHRAVTCHVGVINEVSSKVTVSEKKLGRSMGVDMFMEYTFTQIVFLTTLLLV